MNYKTKDIH